MQERKEKARSIPGLGGSPGRGNGNPLQYSCLEKSMDRGACRPTVHGFTKSLTWYAHTHTHTHTHTRVPETILGAADSLMNSADKTPCSPQNLALKKGWVGTIFKIVLFEPNWGLKSRSQLPRFLWETALGKHGFQHSFISCQNKEHQTSQEYIRLSFQKQKKTTDQYVHSESVWPWHLGRELYCWRRTSIGVPRSKAFNLFFF